MSRIPRLLPQLALFLLVGSVVVACGDDENADALNVDGSATSQTTVPSTTSSSPGSGEMPVLAGDLTVFAAASLTAAFEDVQARLEEANPDLTITYNFAGSPQLVTQLVEGADADVFASANVSQMTAAQEGGVIDNEPVVFTRNRLAIIVSTDNPGKIETPVDLATDGLKIVIANEDVPVGKYTLEMLDLMSADPEFGADFRSNVEANVVSLEDNVKQVVAKVQLGEADAGVVYVTDISADVVEDVALIEVPEAFNITAAYPIASVTDGDRDLAQAFIDFLLSDIGQAILEEHGFTALE